MPKRIEIAPHLSVKELQAKYRAAKNPVTRSQYQIIWLLASGKKTEEVAIATGYTVQWVREVARRYNSSGIEGLGGLAKGECGCTAEKIILEGNLF